MNELLQQLTSLETWGGLGWLPWDSARKVSSENKIYWAIWVRRQRGRPKMELWWWRIYRGIQEAKRIKKKKWCKLKQRWWGGELKMSISEGVSHWIYGRKWWWHYDQIQNRRDEEENFEVEDACDIFINAALSLNCSFVLSERKTYTSCNKKGNLTFDIFLTFHLNATSTLSL